MSRCECSGAPRCAFCGCVVDGAAEIDARQKSAECERLREEIWRMKESLASLQSERDAARATIRNLERMADAGCFLDSYRTREGRMWAVRPRITDWHPTLTLAVAAWAAANPEVK